MDDMRVWMRYRLSEQAVRSCHSIGMTHVSAVQERGFSLGQIPPRLREAAQRYSAQGQVTAEQDLPLLDRPGDLTDIVRAWSDMVVADEQAADAGRALVCETEAWLARQPR
jgi:hypothetical protein